MTTALLTCNALSAKAGLQWKLRDTNHVATRESRVYAMPILILCIMSTVAVVILPRRDVMSISINKSALRKTFWPPLWSLFPLPSRVPVKCHGRAG